MTRSAAEPASLGITRPRSTLTSSFQARHAPQLVPRTSAPFTLATSSELSSPATTPQVPAHSTLDALHAILTEPLAPGETTRAGYDRKEQAIGMLFAKLDPIAARSVRARLCATDAADAVAAAFARITVERRQRLLDFLAGARRRHAITSARR